MLICSSSEWRDQTDFAPDERYEAMWETMACAPLRIVGEDVDRVVAQLRRRAKSCGRPYDSVTRQRLPQCEVKATDLMSLLNPAWYHACNRDVADAGVVAAVHFANWGRDEGRLPCSEIDLVRGLGLVDPGKIIFTMPDVVAADADPVTHFCTIGWRERRRPNPYFNTDWYLKTHSVPAGMNPLLHYVIHGERHGLCPSQHFDPAWYRQRYRLDAAASPLAHYLAFRRTQMFSPIPAFDVAAYVEANAATLRPDRDPYAHYRLKNGVAPAQLRSIGRIAA